MRGIFSKCTYISRLFFSSEPTKVSARSGWSLLIQTRRIVDRSQEDAFTPRLVSSPSRFAAQSALSLQAELLNRKLTIWAWAQYVMRAIPPTCPADNHCKSPRGPHRNSLRMTMEAQDLNQQTIPDRGPVPASLMGAKKRHTRNVATLKGPRYECLNSWRHMMRM